MIFFLLLKCRACNVNLQHHNFQMFSSLTAQKQPGKPYKLTQKVYSFYKETG